MGTMSCGVEVVEHTLLLGSTGHVIINDRRPPFVQGERDDVCGAPSGTLSIMPAWDTDPVRTEKIKRA